MKHFVLIIICVIFSSITFSQTDACADSIHQQVTNNLVAIPIKKAASSSEARLVLIDVFISENKIATIQSWNKNTPIHAMELLFKGLKTEWLAAYNHKKLVFLFLILNQTNGNDQKNNLFLLNDFSVEYINRMSGNKTMLLMKPIIVNTIEDTE